VPIFHVVAEAVMACTALPAGVALLRELPFERGRPRFSRTTC